MSAHPADDDAPKPGTLAYAQMVAEQYGDLEDAAIEDGMDPAPEVESNAAITDAVARKIMLRLGQEIADTQDYHAACRVIREFSTSAPHD